jgi:hypothetical protein
LTLTVVLAGKAVPPAKSNRFSVVLPPLRVMLSPLRKVAGLLAPAPRMPVRVNDYEWRMERMENGEWRMENGEWRMENGEWRMEEYSRTKNGQGFLNPTKKGSGLSESHIGIRANEKKRKEEIKKMGSGLSKSHPEKPPYPIMPACRRADKRRHIRQPAFRAQTVRRSYFRAYPQSFPAQAVGVGDHGH